MAEVSESYDLDALYSIMVEIDWQATRVDKLTKKSIHQKAVIKLKLTPILSYKELAQRLKDEGMGLPDDLPNLNFADYEVSVDIPVDLNSITKESSVAEIDAHILRPVLKSYADMCVMISHRLNQDFKRMKIE